MHLRANPRCCDAYAEADELTVVDGQLIITPTLHVSQPGDSRVFYVEGIAPNSQLVTLETFNGRGKANNFLNEVMGMADKKISGTLEWAIGSYNFVRGCKHNCKYCYARYDALRRHHWVKSVEEWGEPLVKTHRIKPANSKINWYTDDGKPMPGGTVMFPSTHDILPEYIDDAMKVMHGLLDLGYNLLVVSKPHRECVEKICAEFADFKDRVMFRFTIGAMDDDLLSYWEPGAPNFCHRLGCLEYAFQQGFQTSVSCEPMLDSEYIVDLVTVLEPFVTNSIWIGKMNDTETRVEIDSIEDQDALQYVLDGQTDKRILEIYEELKDRPLIKWKESIKEVVGLDLAEEAGLDK